MNTTKRTIQKLTCTLREHVITSEGDFVPAGTPVTVMGWATAEDTGKIEVRAAAYVFAEEWESAATSCDGLDNPATHAELYLAVHPGNLAFASVQRIDR
jgi:hypothetical protein